MDEIRFGRRERRRRKVETKMEGNRVGANEFQKTVENSEFSSQPHVSQSLGKLTRRDTYTVLHSKSDFHMGDVDNIDFHVRSDGSASNSTESRNLTYSLHKDSDSSNHCTYNIDKSPEIRPVPAPRRRKPPNLDNERVSSDTDRDITEIDLDDLRLKSPKSNSSSKPSPKSSPNSEPVFDHRKNEFSVPVPKPRRKLQTPESPEESKHEPAISPGKNSRLEDSNEKSARSETGENSKASAVPEESNELPLVTDLQDEAKSDETKQKSKKRKSIVDLLDRKGRKKKPKTFSSLMKLEKKKMPKISSILKDLKEDEGKDGKPDAEEDKSDFQIDSPRYKESAQNGRIYVQGKNGFHLMKRDDVLKNGNDMMGNDGNGGLMEDSNVKTAVLFQKFWSRSMIYFHGILAGIGFSHAAAVTAIMLHCSYDPQEFISIYSCLSLKIHYVFYMLIAFCIVSSFDRVDIGHMNRRHWDNAWKSPATWAVLVIYLISFVLTFVNQKSEARFDGHPDGNETEIWGGQTRSEIQVSVLQWYHAVWARDVLVLLAWLLIAVSKFEDFLHSHINNMAKYASVKNEDQHRHKTDYF